MKKYFFSLLMPFAFGITNKAQAQFVVTDPPHTTETILNKIVDTHEHLSRWFTLLDQLKESKKIFDQGKEWYDHLKSVTKTVRDVRHVIECVDMVKDIGEMYYNAFSKIRIDPNFRPEEVTSIANGYIRLLEEATKIFNDIKLGTTVSDMSMTDKERIDIITTIYNRLREHHSLVKYYTRKTISISYVRARQSNNVETIFKLYGVK